MKIFSPEDRVRIACLIDLNGDSDSVAHDLYLEFGLTTQSAISALENDTHQKGSSDDEEESETRF